MEEEVDFCLEETKEKMGSTISHFENDLRKIRAGKADPQMLDGIIVDYYGAQTPLNQVANINTTDARTLSIQPWEKQMIEIIEKAIFAANIGLTPVNNGEIIRINIPMLTEERRKQLVKQVRTEGENAKISIRNTRRDANDYLKQLRKDGLSEDAEKGAVESVQVMTNDFIKKIDERIDKKEVEIMTI